jgi:DNA polymerase-3 subunit beta
MRVSCLQENLAKGLATVGRAVATRSTLPVLSNVMLATDQGRLKLSATDLEIGVNCWIGAKVEEEGAITVPARLLIDFVNALPAERIDMALNVRTQELNLNCARYEAHIKGIDAQEFPLIPTADDGEYQLTLEPSLLRQMISQVAFAAATDESRPILTGVLVKFDGPQLTMAAADGFRLSVRYARLENPVSEPISVIIPARALAELGRISSDEELPIGLSITASRSQALFHLSSTDLVSQLIEGRFPDYTQIIPKRHDTQTTVSTDEFFKACRTANIFARSEANIVRLNINDSKMIITASSAEMGDNVTEIDAQIVGEPIAEIAFNVRFLIDVLSVADAAQVILETTNSSSPGVIKPVGAEDFIHVIMPMHVRSD